MMTMDDTTGPAVTLVGLNHRTAPVEVREKLSLAPELTARALTRLRDYASQGVILSTCNRTEVYTVADNPAASQDRLRRFLFDFHSLPLDGAASCLYYYSGQEAVRHLFLVAAGLDSLIVGEYQILGQVKSAFQSAQKSGGLGPSLSRLFRHALRVGRRARFETAIGRNPVSVSHAAVELARKTLGGLSRHQVLVISAGEMGKLTAQSLRGHGASRILIANRTYSRAAQLAARIAGNAILFSKVWEALPSCDVVISATGARGYVLDWTAVSSAMHQRGHRPMLLIDIAVPRDIDPKVAYIPGVTLYDIDDLHLVAEASLAERRGELGKVQAIVDQELDKFMQWWQAQGVVPTLISLQDLGEAVRQQELAEALSKLHHLPVEERTHVEALSRAIVRGLLHRPLVAVKSHPELLSAFQALFGLPSENGAGPAPPEGNET
ncbi:MAG: glutamyl-tRNA reductase [Chloroflexi bacterium]|nr:glutamyl-tRNA reductase [Chloroflexota bacterium]